MIDNQGTTDTETQRQLAKLEAQVAQNRADIEALRAGAAHATNRADAGDERATAHHERMDAFEARFDLDREIIARLQADGLLAEEQAAHLEQALRTSRVIGAAIGIVMTCRKVSQTEAFLALSRASQDTNRKLGIIASEVVAKGDATGIPAAQDAAPGVGPGE